MLTTIVISLDCIAAVVTSRNRAGVICQYVSLSLSIWWCGRVKETLRGTVLTINALLYNLVQWAIGWFARGTIIGEGCIYGTLGTTTVTDGACGLLATLGGGVQSSCCIFGRLATLRGGAKGVSICWLVGEVVILMLVIAGGLHIARKLSMASICLYVLSGNLYARTAATNACRRWICLLSRALEFPACDV